MKQKRLARLWSVVLSFCMVLGMAVPVTTFAADGNSSSNDGIVLNKTATLEDDGTYTINLEAYATGTTTTTTEKSGKPLDIVLVIDQSGSMSDDLQTLKNSVTSFVNTISANAKEYNVDHRIAMVGYACGNQTEMTNSYKSWAWKNTGLFVNGTLKNYATEGSKNTTSSLNAQDYKNALVSVNTNGNVTASVTTAINNLKADGSTFTSYGMEMANKVFENNPLEQDSDRKRIVVVFTDGQPGFSNDKFDTTVAGTAVNNAYETKNTYGATVYTLGFYSNPSNNVKNFMNYLSSNYPQAKRSNSSWSTGTKASDKYYMTTANPNELQNIFTNISQDITNPSTKVTLDENAVMKDIMGNGFTLPSDDQVEIKTIAGTYSANGINWGAETTNSAKAKVENNTVSVTGFNYSDKYIADKHPGEKICVTIKGVLPTDAAVTGEAIDTNNEKSGIYADDTTESYVAFPQPKTILTKKAYVLDYAKKAELKDLDQTASAIVPSMKAVNNDAAVTGTYGKADLESGKLSYTPTTTKWDGYDSFYAFGKSTASKVTGVDANKNGNLWSKVSVIPANNVYYEDDFVTNESNGTVGIVYAGDWTEVGTKGGNTAETDGVHGWQESLADDKEYSDGSAHAADATTAKASFEFTGTGVDIYSRTNLKTGKVIAKLTCLSDNTVKAKTYIANSLAESGDYYQIPTVCFGDLAYGTYKVDLTVATNAKEEGEYTYYLDGIRVYNPIKEDDKTVQDAYGDEANATFTEVRDMLIDQAKADGSDEVNGIVFIDKDANNTSELATYVDYGPKNEVYLAAGQSVVFKVDTANKYYIGLKAPESAAKATVTNGSGAADKAINAASDLYYAITPNKDGMIEVKNNGDNLLSITKLRTTGSGESGLMTMSLDEALAYADDFAAMSETDNNEPAISEDNGTVDKGDVVIENPVQPEGTQGGNHSEAQSAFGKIFSQILGWFGGRR